MPNTPSDGTYCLVHENRLQACIEVLQAERRELRSALSLVCAERDAGLQREARLCARIHEMERIALRLELRVADLEAALEGANARERGSTRPWAHASGFRRASAPEAAGDEAFDPESVWREVIGHDR